MKYNLEEDTKDLKKMRLITREESMDEIWDKINRKSWWLLILNSDSYELLNEIERSFYWVKPKTAGFGLIPFFDDNAVVAFCHKSCMNSKQLSAILTKHGAIGTSQIDEDYDIVFGFTQPLNAGTYEWLDKIDHRPLSKAEIDEIERNPDVSNDIKEILLLRRFYNEVITNCSRRETQEKYK